VARPDERQPLSVTAIRFRLALLQDPAVTNARRLIVFILAAALSGCGGGNTPVGAPSAASSVPTATATSPSPVPRRAEVGRQSRRRRADRRWPARHQRRSAGRNTDPNNLLGRPGGYLSRAFDVPGGDKDSKPYGIDRGGVVEVFADAGAAQTRSKYIQDTLKSMQMLGTEYHCLNGPVLVRITGKVKPSVAKPFEAAVAGLKVA
jgi:hypothetical protein